MDLKPKDLFGAENSEEEIDFLEVAAQLAFSGQLESPSPGLKARLMAAITAPAEMHVLRGDAVKWRATPYAGVSYRSLFIDRETKMHTLILRLDAGAVYPRHRHTRPEQCLVLSGDVENESVTLKAGDFEWMAGETIHNSLTTRGGCELLIIASLHDEVMA
jgi:anti-sigma factor ChrR (cupin superfamily)